MPETTQVWVNSLDRSQFEKVAALGQYHRQAMLLFIHTDEWFHAHFVEGRTEDQRHDIFDEFFLPYYAMWTSMVYVVDEGFVALDIKDTKLQKARDAIDMKLLRRFRNATFHY